MTKRREFLIGCGSVLAAAGLPAVSLAVPAKTSAGTLSMRSGFSKAKFDALLNQRFRVSRGRRALFEAQLTQVRGEASRPTREEFTVVFQGNAAAPLPAGIYDLRHHAAGRFQLYLEPATKSRGADAYTATFNLMV